MKREIACGTNGDLWVILDMKLVWVSVLVSTCALVGGFVMLLVFIHFYCVPHSLTGIFAESTCNIVAILSKVDKTDGISYTTQEMSKMSNISQKSTGSGVNMTISSKRKVHQKGQRALKIEHSNILSTTKQTFYDIDISSSAIPLTNSPDGVITKQIEERCVHLMVEYVDYSGMLLRGELFQDSWVYYQVIYGTDLVSTYTKSVTPYSTSSGCHSYKLDPGGRGVAAPTPPPPPLHTPILHFILSPFYPQHSGRIQAAWVQG